jgi:hypothetical protein
MKHSVSHSLGREMARKVARAAFESYAKRFSDYNPVTTWKTDDAADIRFSAKGIDLKGAVAVTEHSIDLDLNVPFLLRPLQGKAVSVIEKELQLWIEKAKKGELG